MSKPLDRLGLLETFVRIAERGTISGAARDLGMSQGSASRQLKELEDRLGIQLIRRTTHSLALTEAGLDVLSDARSLISRWDTLEERHAGDTDILKGPLRVVAPVALGQLHLADIAIAFQVAHPNIMLNWRLEDEVIRFAEVGCDCWIKVGPVPDESLIVRRLGQVERLIVGTPSIADRLEACTPEAASRLPFVTLTPFEGAKIGLKHSDGERFELSVNSSLATNNIMSLKHAVQSGVGAAVLPLWFVAEELENGALVDLLPNWRAATLDVNLAYLPARRQPRRLSAFIEALETGFRRIPGMTA
ncbi:LysR family transcriptional regulator [uncultured Roseibium sp.]|uniref:LysR family transcriptional regulator n=1 Tax=uncultured Roseibium sp. TaxID=1936171 RepID=UPI002634E70A|nr:LysR family transcriptional regulator [uncultured Roseibium sp.]